MLLREIMGKYTVVTGGAGFIGSCVICDLNNQGIDDIIVIDSLGTDERWKNLVGKRFCDLIEIEEGLSWLGSNQKEVQAIIHLGACSDTTEKDALFLLQNNYRFSVDLAKIAFSQKIRFIYASSAATYGDGTQGFSDSHKDLPLLHPLNMYGYSKHLFDLWLLRHGLLDQAAGLKYFNVYGPNEEHKGKMRSLIPKVLPSLLEGKPLELFASDKEEYENGGQMRDFIYVKDAASLTTAFLDSDSCGIFNIGTAEPVSWNRLGKAIFKALGMEENISYIEMPKELKGKYQYYTRAKIEKLQKALGEKVIFTPLEEAVCDYVQNYLLPKRQL